MYSSECVLFRSHVPTRCVPDLQSMPSYSLVILILLGCVAVMATTETSPLNDTLVFLDDDNNSGTSVDTNPKVSAAFIDEKPESSDSKLDLDSTIFLAKSGRDEELNHKHPNGLDKVLAVDDDLLRLVALKSQEPLGPVKSNDADDVAAKEKKDTEDEGSDKWSKYDGNSKHLASGVTVQGCYTDKSKALKLIYNGSDNTMVRCANACANRGYPIAASSQGTKCFCAYDTPLFLMKAWVCTNSDSPSKIGQLCTDDEDASCPGGKCIPFDGAPQCNIPCAGVYQYFSDKGCRHAYCCGSSDGEYYTVATVGVLNPVRQLMRRIAMNLTSDSGKLVKKVFANAFSLKTLSSFQMAVPYASGFEYDQQQAEAKAIASHGFLVSYCNDNRSQANWVTSFDVAGWSSCNAGMLMIGLFRSNCDTLMCIEYAMCATPCAGPASTTLTLTACETISWASTFNRVGMSQCPVNKYLTALYRGSDEALVSISQVKCCGVIGDKTSGVEYSCSQSNWWSTWDFENRWAALPENQFLSGIWRNWCEQLHCVEEGRGCIVRVPLSSPVPQSPLPGFSIGPDYPRNVIDFNGDSHVDILFMDLLNQMGVIYWGPEFRTYQVITLPVLGWIDDIDTVLNASNDGGSTLSTAPEFRNVSKKYSSVFMSSTVDARFDAKKCVDGLTTFDGNSMSACFAGWRPAAWRVSLEHPAYIHHVDVYTLNIPLLNLQGCSVRLIPDVQPVWKIITIPPRNIQVRIMTYPGEQFISLNDGPTVVDSQKSASQAQHEALAFIAEKGQNNSSHLEFLDGLATQHCELLKSYNLFVEEEADPMNRPADGYNANPDTPPKTDPSMNDKMRRAEKKGKKDFEDETNDTSDDTSSRSSSPLQQAYHTVTPKMKNVKSIELICNPGFYVKNKKVVINSMLFAFEVQAYGFTIGPGSVDVGDVNGDGVADIVSITPIGSYMMDYSSSFSNKKTPRENKALAPGTSVTLSNESISRLNGYNKVIMDVNNDQRADLVSFHREGYDVLLSDSGVWIKQESWSKSDFSHNQGFVDSPVLVADINNDGCSDMLRFCTEDDSRMYFKTSNCESSFKAMVPVGVFNGMKRINWERHAFLFVDVTGDQFKDLCRIGDGSVSCMFNDGHGTGFGFESTIFSYTGDTFISSTNSPAFRMPPSSAALSPTTAPTSKPSPTPIPTRGPPKVTPTPTSAPSPTLAMASTEVVDTYLFDRIFIVPDPGSSLDKRVRVLESQKITVAPEEVRIELIHSFDNQIYYINQMATRDISFLRLTIDDYRTTFGGDPPTIVKSEMKQTGLTKSETNTAPAESNYIDTNDIVLQNNTNTEQTISKDYSVTSEKAFNLSIEVDFAFEADPQVAAEPVGAGATLSFTFDIIPGAINMSFGWTWAVTEGFSLDVVVPEKKTFTARFKEEKKDVIIKFKATYYAYGDVGLRVIRGGADVYLTSVYIDELLANEQRQFVKMGQIKAGMRSQYHAIMNEVLSGTDDLGQDGKKSAPPPPAKPAPTPAPTVAPTPTPTPTSPLKPRTVLAVEKSRNGSLILNDLTHPSNLLYCGTAHELNGHQVFDGSDGKGCAGGAARLALRSHQSEMSANEAKLHPHIRKLVKKEVLEERRPTVVHSWN